MTIGIAAFGPHAGLAVFKALRAAERVGTGSIGGFATFAAIGKDGRLLRHQTQRGGSATLFIHGEITGTEPPPEVATATFAGVISSGPERPGAREAADAPTPRSAWSPVTACRSPSASTGVAVNQQVLELMKAGQPAQQAVDEVMDRNPEIDAGLIAVDRQGQVYGRNSARVLRRPDLAQAHESRDGASVVVFYNAIRPWSVLTGVVTAIAFDTMLGIPQPDAIILVRAGTPVVAGDETAIHGNADGVATHVTTNEHWRLTGHQICTGIYLDSPVYLDGKLVGRTMLETLTSFQDGKIAQMSGQTAVSFGYRTVR